MDLKSKVFYRITTALAVICFGMLFIVPSGTPEFIILIVSGIINSVCAIMGLIFTIKDAKKEKEEEERISCSNTLPKK